MKKLLFITTAVLLLASCTENYSNGERIGLITQFSKTGLMFKTHEGHLNLTQTGMNSSSAVPFDFSVDADAYGRGLGVKSFNSLIQSLQQTEWDVEVVTEPMNLDEIREQGKGFLNSNTNKPKIDSNGCLILKKK